MSDASHTRVTCDLCGRDAPEGRLEREDGSVFCSDGCRDVALALEGGDPPSPERPDASAVPDDSTSPDGPEGETDRAYFRVDGMHRPTCESYLEGVARSRDGVVDAEASYVTETVRVAHDPDRVSESELRDALSTLGYTAYVRDEATGGDEATGRTRRSREMHGMRKRRTEDMLDARYIAGIVFGAFLLVPYATVLYPVHLADLYDGGVLSLWAGTFEGGGFLFLRTYAVLTGIVLYFTGMPVLRGAYVALATRRPNADLLVALTATGAFAYSTIAAVLGRPDVYYDATIVIVAGVMAASFYESTVKGRAVDRLTELTISQVDTARRYEEGTGGNGDPGLVEVDATDLEPGDRVLVRQGERVPIDGTLDEGTCTVDEAVVTGESLPVRKREGDAVVGGSVVTDDGAVVRVGDGAASSIDRLTRSVWDLQSADHGVQRRADDLSGRAALAVVGVAALAGLAALVLDGPTTAVLVALLAVIAVCPWALGLATPLSVAASIEQALDRGIVVFDETVFERLDAVDVVVFDKTGTLTTGEMDVREADGPTDLFRAAAALERRASHPAADAIVTAFAAPEDDERATGTRTDGGVDGHGRPSEPAKQRVSEVRTHATGVGGTVDGSEILVGHPDLFADQGWSVPDDLTARAADARAAGRLPVVVGRGGVAEGIVVLGDEPRAGWDETVSRLGESGIDVVVLTGDDEAAADAFASHPHVEHVFASVPPEGKTAAVRRLRADGRVAMVGDGTNDAPALAEADLGISLGSGTALASDAADLAVLEDDLGAVETAFSLARAARRRVRQNVGLAFAYNALAVPAAIAGLLNPLVAMVGIVITGLALLGNASRDLLED